MNTKLEERLQYVKKTLPAMLFLGLFGLGFFRVAGELIMQPKREQAIMAAYKLAADFHNILMFKEKER